MDIESIRELFETASIVFGENGVSVQYPPRDSSVYRNCSIISEPCNPTIADMIATSKKFSIYIGADGLRFDFSIDGNDVIEMYRMSPISMGITYDEARHEYMTTVGESNESGFMKFFEGADLSDGRDLLVRFVAYMDEREAECATNVENFDDFKRWKEIQRLSNKILPVFDGFEYEVCDGMTEFSMGQIKDSKTIVFTEKNKDIVEKLFRVSSTTKNYSCIFGDSWLSLQFCID